MLFQLFYLDNIPANTIHSISHLVMISRLLLETDRSERNALVGMPSDSSEEKNLKSIIDQEVAAQAIFHHVHS